MAFDSARPYGSIQAISSNSSKQSKVHPRRCCVGQPEIVFVKGQGVYIWDADGIAMSTTMPGLTPGCYPDYVLGKTPNSAVTMEAIVDHICQLVGNAHHAAIGSDLDGGFGKEQSPNDLETIADLQKAANLLRTLGYSKPDVEAVLHANWVSFFRTAWS